MALSVLSRRLGTMSRAMPELVLSHQRAIANAGAAVERNRRAAAERAAAEAPSDLDSVRRLLGAAVVL